MTDKVRDYLAAIGSKGGKATGKSKVRGDADYYRRINQKAAAARKKSSGALRRRHQGSCESANR